MRSQIEILHFAAFGHFAGAAAEDKGFARPGFFKATTGSVGVGVSDEEDGLFFVADHARGQVVGGGVFAHHAGGDDKEPAAGQLHLLGLAVFQHDEI